MKWEDNSTICEYWEELLRATREQFVGIKFGAFDPDINNMI